MQIVIISGLSGSGKSIALNMLEDGAYFCVDNLPSPLLQNLVDLLEQRGYANVAVAIDIRGGESIENLPQQLSALRSREIDLQFVFLDAKTETLIKRFSETRRRHPLSGEKRALVEAIAEERRRLNRLAELGHHIDTSDLKPDTLRDWIRCFVAQQSDKKLTLLFESFGFKNGIPLDAELVFDVRCLPNPFYDLELRPLTGRDPAVADFLEAQPEVVRMRGDIEHFIENWLPDYSRADRNYLTVGIGCTGGRHRSVYLAEWLGRRFADEARVLVRHREIPSAPAS
ncbi:MAG: RNase adapter RapZ [Candidatus Accumulibacter sp.]|jgi:UPF0042 nucleotide-binding protein|nr:RNase adapter RapZ [Accumulibacter sp.]